MKAVNFLVAIGFLALASSIASAYDPSPLQNFCVAINNSAVFVNGKVCKDPNFVTANDFFFPGFNIPRNTSNQLGSNVTLLNVGQIVGLNTLGISLARIDYAPYGGLNAPHYHPRSSEILTVLEGVLYAGFVTANPDNRLFSKILYPGDVIAFPLGLIHFQLNLGNTSAVAIASLGSQNPGVVTVANTIFRSNPPVNPESSRQGLPTEKEYSGLPSETVWREQLLERHEQA